MAHVIEGTEETFQKELATDQLVLVDFWANWCGPCKRLAPVIDDIAREFQGKLKIIKIDADNNPTIAEKHEVSSLPTLLFIKNRQSVDVINGFVQKSTIVEKIQSLL
jgi:thioredoxin 1